MSKRPPVAAEPVGARAVRSASPGPEPAERSAAVAVRSGELSASGARGGAKGERAGTVRERDRRVARVLWLVLGANVAVAAAKLSVGASIGALSLLADGLHTALDASSNVVALFGLAIASRPPNRDHPYGHRRFETLAAVVIGMFIAGGVIENRQRRRRCALGASRASPRDLACGRRRRRHRPRQRDAQPLRGAQGPRPAEQRADGGLGPHDERLPRCAGRARGLRGRRPRLRLGGRRRGVVGLGAHRLHRLERPQGKPRRPGRRRPARPGRDPPRRDRGTRRRGRPPHSLAGLGRPRPGGPAHPRRPEHVGHHSPRQDARSRRRHSRRLFGGR